MPDGTVAADSSSRKEEGEKEKRKRNHISIYMVQRLKLHLYKVLIFLCYLMQNYSNMMANVFLIDLFFY